MESSNLSTSAMTQSIESQEEIIIMSSVKDMVKYFLRENVIIWHDPNVHSSENTAYITELKNICDVQVFVDWKEASNYLKKETQLSCCKVITSGTNGELFVKEISSLPFITSIYVFCGNISYHKTWANQYLKIMCVENRFESVLEKIKQSMITWQRTSSSLRVDLPSFAPIFDDVDLSKMNNLQFYLQGFVNFKNRSQAKKDFIDLARALYGKNKHIEEFEKNYNQYDMKTILNWYTKECFLYKLTNNCLRIAKPDSIQYSRLLLKDLETAIKDKYQQESHKFSGLLYRGAYLSDNEWTRLQQNCGREIEMHGFLSTTKQKEVAFNFCKTDLNKKALISIIVPNFPEKGEQGFAEMSNYTDFPGEDEVLFNVRSRFTVLEVTMEEIDGIKMRHLVLLYGAQAMRRYTTLHNPFIEVQISITQTTKCNECKQQISKGEESVIAVDIYENHKYLCTDCIKQSHQTNRLVSLCFSPLACNMLSSSSEKSKTINLKIEGTMMPYQDSLNVPFYGDQCVICKGTKLNCCYRCINCEAAKKIYCNNCFHDQNINNCLQKGHMVIAQGYSFCFWSDKMYKMEEHHFNYQKKQLKKNK
jgi:hypothetical protein